MCLLTCKGGCRYVLRIMSRSINVFLAAKYLINMFTGKNVLCRSGIRKIKYDIYTRKIRVVYNRRIKSVERYWIT